MVFTPNLICRFFLVTCHCQCYYCHFTPCHFCINKYCRFYYLAAPFSAPISCSLPLSPSPPSLMATQLRRSPYVPSLPPPSPKSPPEYPDLYGKRRETARVQMIEREISFLEEELKYVEALQPASRCCKEIADFVVANSDPLLPTNKNGRRSCDFWKWLSGMACWKLSWMWCCCCEECCCANLKWGSCCCCESIGGCCCWPKQMWAACSGGSCCCNTCWCWPCPKSNCCERSRHCCIPQSCCSFQCDSCPSCCTCKCSCSCSCPTCPKLRPCCSCTNSCGLCC